MQGALFYLEFGFQRCLTILTRISSSSSIPHPSQASGIAQLFPPLRAPLITLVTTLLVPKDPFSKPYVDIIIEGARSGLGG